MTLKLYWHFSFGDISVLVIFQRRWNAGFGEISVLVTFQVGDMSVLVTFQFWWHFCCGERFQFLWYFSFCDILLLLSAQRCNRQPTTTRIYCLSRFSPTRPSGPGQSSSRDVQLFIYIYMSPSLLIDVEDSDFFMQKMYLIGICASISIGRNAGFFLLRW